MNRRLPPWLAWSLVALWFASLNVASFIPGPDVKKAMFFPGFDKVLHFGAFFIGAFLLHTAFSVGRSTARWPRWRRTLLTILLLSLFGAFDEFRQIWTPGRDGADIWDFSANLLGTLGGAFLSHTCHAYIFCRIRP